MSITIRSYRDDDAHAIAELYRRHPDNPNPVAGGVSGAELAAELAERDTATFLVAEDEGRVVGTFGLFHSTGRRCARAGELIADMFFVAPAYRNGVLTGRLFTEAVEQMIGGGCLVLRLTVNPANSVAFKLYRRVGCVSVGQTVPGEDGNVELHNYLPLILRSVYADLGSEVRKALGQLGSFGNVTESRDDRLRSDVRVVNGVRTVSYSMAMSPYHLTALVDVDRGVVLEAELRGPDEDTRRTLRITQPPYQVAAARASAPYRFGGGPGSPFSCEVDDVDGTVRVFADGHLGPVLVSTWPSGAADSAGWREGQPLDLEIAPIANGVRVVEHCEGREFPGTITFTEGRLCQEFSAVPRRGRVFQTTGLRQGSFAEDDPAHGPAPRRPLGIGLAVRDSSEVVAAARLARQGGELDWTGDGVRISVPVRERIRLVHSGLIERRLEPDETGVARLVTEFRVPRPASPAPRAAASGPLAGAPGLRLDAAAGGVVAWTQGSTKVLRTPYPRTRAFGCNPRWSAGMWVSWERGRESRDSGLGWGLHTTQEWVEKHPLGLYEPRERIGWEVAGSPAAAEIDVHIQAPDSKEEIALWITPNTPRRAAAVIESAGTRWELDSDEYRQVWAAAAAVRLADGRWLEARPAPGTAGHPEIVLRSTSSGLLIGCVAAGGPGGAECTWRLSVREQPSFQPESNSNL